MPGERVGGQGVEEGGRGCVGEGGNGWTWLGLGSPREEWSRAI